MKLFDEKGLKYSAFVEPDLGNEITSITVEPEARKLVSSLPLMLREKELVMA